MDQPGVGIVADLPTDCADPIERVARCRAAMDAAKRQFELLPAEAMVDITQYSSPVVATAAIRLASQLRLADRVRCRSTWSSPTSPAAPAAVLRRRPARAVHPVSTITEGMGLNITVHSYLDEMTSG